MLAFAIKWVGLIVVALLAYNLFSRIGLDKVMIGQFFSMAGILGWLIFFMGSRFSIKG